MTSLETMMMLVSSSTLLGYIFASYLRVQPTIAILGLSLLIVTGANLLEPFTGRLEIYNHAAHLIEDTNFKAILMELMLPILLFAGSMSMNADYFKKHAYSILTLAFFSTAASTLLIGYGFYYVMQFTGVTIDLVHCLLFGALISPTDPVAVVGLVKQSNLSPDIEAKIAGESLFNDGIGIVIFLSIYQLAFEGSEALSPSTFAAHFCYEAIGGSIIGIITGRLCQKLITLEKSNTHNHTLISIFIVTGVYTLTNTFGMSGPLAVVVCGLMMAQHTGRNSEHFHPLKHFWESLEEILNMLLYLLIGFEAFLIPFSYLTLSIMASSITLALLSRIITITIPMCLINKRAAITPKTKRILIWGGLRGGLAVALALSLPESAQTATILIATYAVVCFTTIVQGGTISRLLKS